MVIGLGPKESLLVFGGKTASYMQELIALIAEVINKRCGLGG